MTSAPDRATVLDTSVLSNFAHVDRVELLADLPRPATVTAVRGELESGRETHSYLAHALSVLDEPIPVCRPSPVAEKIESELVETLDPGEAQVLAVAAATGGTVVTDDGDARSCAIDREIPITGSIGLLVRFVEDSTLTRERADEYLKRWIDEAGFRSPARDIDPFLTE
jgi:predicted nucleic acid-binding protein